MRVLLSIVVVLLAGGFLGFLGTNLQTTVPVTIFTTLYPTVPLWLVVLVALAVSFVLTSIYSIAEGAQIRLENRRLRRDLHKIENELNYLRTQPRSDATFAPAAAGVAAGAAGPAALVDEDEPHVPTAPVYESGADDWETDPDDDVYTGGRAV